MAADRPRRGFEHHHTDEELARYRKLSPEQKLRWLHDAWQLTREALTPERREAWQKMRAGVI